MEQTNLARWLKAEIEQLEARIQATQEFVEMQKRHERGMREIQTVIRDA